MRGIATAWALLALACGGCQVGPTSGDGGAEEAGTSTVGDQCTQIVTEFCMQAIGRCAAAVTFSDCSSTYMASCCVGSVCNRTSSVSSQGVAVCKQAIDAADCNSIATAGFPPECASIPRSS
ncbi:MAG TPA: hypothetical protein VKU41_02200 [Polyangiaceae bacterium]|nr:hypothetical protein [Polyangiaceae bacterium]